MRYRLATATFAVLIAAAAAAQNTDLLVSTGWLQGHLGRRGVIVVEVGDRATYEKEHIRGARFLALSEIAVTRNEIANELPSIAVLETAMRTAGIPDRDHIVIYSRDILAAARLFFTLDYLGCGLNISLLDGGYAKWSAESRPVESGAPPQQTSTFTACPHPEKVVNLAAMRRIVDLSRIGDSSIAIIDARPPAAFFGTEAGQGIVRPGHIPGATNIPWDENLTSSATPVLRAPEDLKSLYADAGVRDGTAVAYCRTGMQASVTYFALRYLGREVYLYDGSYMEWNCAEGTTVERAPGS
ncbi:MAG TPA: sulfurtransferase [Thermoanaerobaculia bacterium]|nr:sulfurtransferase [Thermoanaerobaculia bacterium]